ncbi:hypothetical protein P3X46_034558 [Hevea brasiliensis]|uniref:Non-specific lipid-transfer protein n=1 Tax=Hevea brasiliensis TaxID=3981 RepID=A0ABQ9KEA8_HEVBR|nr:non-specific lipid-transfer protein 1 [Hevea brasiliensis]KAJ9132044.1 hypothetical protein P3X46_034558 [Hevea brasiliensis]
MACSMATKLACVLLMCLVVGEPLAYAAITCGDVTSKLAPCISYLRGIGTLPSDCCSGVKALNSEAKTTPDRQDACKCLKSSAANVPGLNYSLASGLAGKCGVSLPFTISPNIDCSKVK